MEQHDKELTGRAIRDGVYTTPPSVPARIIEPVTIYDPRMGACGMLRSIMLAEGRRGGGFRVILQRPPFGASET